MTNDTPRYINHYPLSQLVVRFFVGFLSGFTGTVVLGILMLATWSVIGDYISGENVAKDINGIDLNDKTLNPIFVIVVGIAIFLTTMVSNIVYNILIPLVDDKYEQKKLALSNIFIGGLVLAGMMIPIYTIGSASFYELGVGISGIMHATLFSIYTILIMEIVNKNNYLIVSTLGVLLGVILFVAISMILFTGSDSNSTILILLTLPILMGCMSLANTMSEGIYGWFYKTYGTDTLSGK